MLNAIFLMLSVECWMLGYGVRNFARDESSKHRRVGHPCPTHSAFIYSWLSGYSRDAIPSYHWSVGLLFGIHVLCIECFSFHCHAISLPNPNSVYMIIPTLYIIILTIYIIRCNSCIPFVHPLFPPPKTPAFQKESFCLPKRVLLLTKRSPFALQKESFYNPKGVLL